MKRSNSSSTGRRWLIIVQLVIAIVGILVLLAVLAPMCSNLGSMSQVMTNPMAAPTITSGKPSIAAVQATLVPKPKTKGFWARHFWQILAVAALAVIVFVKPVRYLAIGWLIAIFRPAGQRGKE